MSHNEKNFSKNELNNNVLLEIFRCNFPHYKIYIRNREKIKKVVVQKNKSVAIGAHVIKDNNAKRVKFEDCDTDSFLHMNILPWFLILFGFFPGIIWFVINMMKGIELQTECISVLDRYFEVVEEPSRDLVIWK